MKFEFRCKDGRKFTHDISGETYRQIFQTGMIELGFFPTMNFDYKPKPEGKIVGGFVEIKRFYFSNGVFKELGQIA